MYKIVIITADSAYGGEDVHEHILFDKDGVAIKDGFLNFTDESGGIHAYSTDTIYRYRIRECRRED